MTINHLSIIPIFNSKKRKKRKESRIHRRSDPFAEYRAVTRDQSSRSPLLSSVYSFQPAAWRFADLAFPADSRERVAYCGACAAATRPGPMPAAPFRSVLVCAEDGSGRRSADRRRVVVSSIVRCPACMPD